MSAPIHIDEKYEVGDILEDSKRKDVLSRIIITEVREFGYSFRYIDADNNVTGPIIQTEKLNDIRTFTYFKKL